LRGEPDQIKILKVRRSDYVGAEAKNKRLVILAPMVSDPMVLNMTLRQQGDREDSVKQKTITMETLFQFILQKLRLMRFGLFSC